jgi:hypothetical protein
MGPPASLVVRNRYRRTLGLTLQDGIDLRASWPSPQGCASTVTATWQPLTPRLAVVFPDRHIVKLQYAEGFRAPTFFELYERH